MLQSSKSLFAESLHVTVLVVLVFGAALSVLARSMAVFSRDKESEAREAISVFGQPKQPNLQKMTQERDDFRADRFLQSDRKPIEVATGWPSFHLSNFAATACRTSKDHFYQAYAGKIHPQA